MLKADWQAIAEEYITGEISMRSLAIKYALPRSTLRSRAYREGWIERREAFQRASAPAEDGAAASPAEDEAPSSPERAAYESEIFRVTDKLVRRAEEILDGPESVGARELGEEALRRQGRWTHVIDPIDLSRGTAAGWKICRSYDFGYGKPFSCAWWAVDYDGVVYRVLELYGCTKTPNEGVKWTPERHYLTLIVAIWYSFTELGSIVENAGLLGAPIPQWLKKGIALLRDKADGGSGFPKE